ncbi:NAD(P)-binding protein [Schizophyllum commune H4-8]|uniref:NAD(P)-binding protein n=1 Tax=Schizophyllum commune (strain H4-8 / FGSC 9210) TaxID=578458 RepID=UPI00215EDF06|nr:NAD(P)-binding protein [Schizophyllum commune H4-8]KAI5889999.1 NAD(P)-binding protein [Schizophyllum commune H4-8]
MATSSTVYLVSGSNRGIGLALVTHLASRPNTIVFAGARNPDAASALHALVEKHPNRVHVVELKAGDVEGNERAVEEIKRKAGQLDVVIANAAICKDMQPLTGVSPESMQEHYDVNVIGTLVLFQAVYPLMKTSPARKFIVIGAHGGAITTGPEYGVLLGPYAITKAAVHYLAKKLQFENEDFVIFPILPGLVDTDMYHYAQSNSDYLAKRPGVTTAECAAGIMRVVDGATRETAGGKFMDAEGGVNEW